MQKLTRLLLLLVVSTSPLRLFAQGGATGAISGRVKDPTGAVIGSAVITVVEEKTGGRVSVKSQADGAFLVPQLIPASYRITAEAVGFKRLIISGLTVDVETTLTQDLVLEVGGTTEKIEVQGRASLVETTSGGVGTLVSVSHVLEMPLVDRNVFNLVNLVPTAVLNNGYLEIGGGRTQSALAMVDGVQNTRGGLAVTNIELSPPVDSMQEFKVEVSSFGAEYGHTSAGLVNAVTKQGGNQFHGSFYEFVRNNDFDATGWGNDNKPPLHRNNFGGTIGGPIRKNRTFFFYNLDVLLEHDGVSNTRNVGLPAWRTGDFSTATRDAAGKATPIVIYDPNTGTGTPLNPLATTPFPNAIIPASRLDPVAVKALGYVPGPNRAANDPANQTGNWQQNSINTTTTGYHTIRVDHELTAATKVFVREVLTQPETNLTGYSQGYGPADPAGLLIHNRRQNLAINATHLFSATRFLNYTMGFNRVYIHRTSGDCCDTNWGQKLGIPNVPGEVFPLFTIAGGTVPVDSFGAVGNANRIATITNFDYVGNMTEIHGRHTLKYGIQYTRDNANDLSRSDPSGVWTFNGMYTRGINANGTTVANTGMNMADFLLGRMSAASVQVSPGIGKRLQYYGAYFQDDWRIAPRLTLNLGIRYETESPATEVAGRMSNLNPYLPDPLAGQNGIPAGTLGVMQFPGLNGVGKYLWNWNYLNFAPRFGFAWRVFGDNDTVVRGGFGLFYGDAYDRELIQEERVGFDNSYQARTPVPFTLAQGAPPGSLDGTPVSALTPSFGNRGTAYPQSLIQYLDPHRKTPYSENANISIQHQWKGILFEISGLGTFGRQLIFGNINMNLIPENLLSQTQIQPYLRRPFPQFDSDQAQIQILAPNWGISNYLAFTFKTEKRFSNGLGWVISYAYTHWIDNLIFFGGTFGDTDQIQNIYNIKGERSASQGEIPQRLVVSPIYDLPFGKGRTWLQHGILSQIIGGWQVGAIGTMQTGSPFGSSVLNGPVNYLGDSAAGTTLRPNLVMTDLASPNQGQPAVGQRGVQWLNPAAFAIPALYTHGNASRTLPGVLSPKLINFDMMLSKNFLVRERWRAQIRWEAFDATNTPYFQVPNESVGNGSFGIINSVSATSRRIMQLGAKLYW